MPTDTTDASAAPPLVLGSTSPYRRELLSRLRLPFTTAAPQVDETPLPHETPAALARRLALARREVAAPPAGHRHRCRPGGDLAGEPLGKPGVRTRRGPVQRMSGQTVVFSDRPVGGVLGGFEQSELAPVEVRFRALDAGEIERYLRAEQPYDCAGSAKSEGLGIALLEAIHNDDPTALVGLPLIRTARLLRAAGLRLP